jgi:hypothetical protein
MSLRDAVRAKERLMAGPSEPHTGQETTAERLLHRFDSIPQEKAPHATRSSEYWLPISRAA